MKYIDAERLKEEIERRRKFHDDAVIKFCNNRTIALTHSAGLKEDEELLSLIDSLQQEQPEVDLNAEIEKELRLHYNDDQDVYWWNYLKNSFRHFYEFGLNARKEE